MLVQWIKELGKLNETIKIFKYLLDSKNNENWMNPFSYPNNFIT